MHGLRLKVDLFEITVSDQSRNRFKLKNDVRVDQYLNVGFPT